MSRTKDKESFELISKDWDKCAYQYNTKKRRKKRKKEKKKKKKKKEKKEKKRKRQKKDEDKTEAGLLKSE